MKIESQIFRQYDIRGIAGKDLNEDIAEAIGKAFGTYTAKSGEKKAVVGYDNRISSESIKTALIKGITSTGIDVLDCGTIISPALYYSRILFGTNAGVMVTASHNPPEYNGFKLCSIDGGTMYGQQLQDIKEMIEQENYISGKGIVKKVEIIESYIEMIAEKIKLSKKLKVVVDCGNGTASLFAVKLFEKMGCEVIPIFCDSNPLFPNHFPDPVKAENLKDAKGVVLKNNADLAIGFDGDGDRLGVVDEKGNIIWGDQLMILFWREIMPKHPGAKAIVEVKCSQSLVDEIKKLNGEPLFYKTGHSLIKAKMKEINAIFTGEMSGHMFFADEYYGFDDALYAAGRLLRILSNTDKTLSELLSDINKYYSTPEIRVKSSDTEKFEQVEKVRRFFREKGTPMIEVDGVRAIFKDGWGLVRASNTGPELIVRCEDKTQEGLEEIIKEMESALGMSKIIEE
ncbi:MAG: phosphomannomutase/phosphoglucomutase [Ignavibacteriales bacterium]